MIQRIPHRLVHAAADPRRLASVLAFAIVLGAGIWTQPASGDVVEHRAGTVAEPGHGADDRLEAIGSHGTAWAVRGADIQVLYERVAERKSGGGSGAADPVIRGGADRHVIRSAPSAVDAERSASPSPLFYLHAALLL